MLQKGLLFIFAFSLTAVVASAQTLFSYGNKTVSKSEFLGAFNKNPDTVGNKEEKLRQYLDLYVNFKLKTQAARDEKLDKRPQFQAEVADFRNQLIENYVNEQANISQLIQEAFNRSQKDIRVSQVFIEFHNNDTIGAFKSINEAYDQLKNGTGFSKVSSEYSTDQDLKNAGGDIGYVTVFSLPYPIENIVYELPENGYSSVYKSGIGYHIFKKTGERPAVGERKIQQILFTVPPSFSDDQKQQVARLADSVYDRLKKGDSFDEMVSRFGVPTSNYGGEQNILEVSVGQYEPAFEEKVFALQQKGDISKPFLTGYGYNIIKLIEKIPVVTDPADVVYRSKLQTRIQDDKRLTIQKDALIEKWMQEGEFKPGKFTSNDLFRYTDSTFKAGKPVPSLNGMTPESVLFSFRSQNYTVSDWFRFFNASRQEGASFMNGTFGQVFTEFKKAATRDYFENHIDEYYPPIGEQIREFKEANLLFSVMDEHVWTKASTDSVGLVKYYRQNMEKYKWQPGASVLSVSASDKAVLDTIGNAVSEDPKNWRDIIAKYNHVVVADSSRLENAQIPFHDLVTIEKGFLLKPVENKEQQTYSILYVFDVFNEPALRNFEDARGMVINDYQQVLEKKWLDQLKKKYPVKINEAVFKSML